MATAAYTRGSLAQWGQSSLSQRNVPGWCASKERIDSEQMFTFYYFRYSGDDNGSPSLDIEVEHDDCHCCMGEGGKMFKDGEKMIGNSGVELSCYKGNWVNIVQVEEDKDIVTTTPVGFPIGFIFSIFFLGFG